MVKRLFIIIFALHSLFNTLLSEAETKRRNR